MNHRSNRGQRGHWAVHSWGRGDQEQPLEEVPGAEGDEGGRGQDQQEGRLDGGQNCGPYKLAVELRVEESILWALFQRSYELATPF